MERRVRSGSGGAVLLQWTGPFEIAYGYCTLASIAAHAQLGQQALGCGRQRAVNARNRWRTRVRRRQMPQPRPRR